MWCVEMTDVISGHRSLIPSAIAFHPQGNMDHHSHYDGSSANGICSGNSLIEAIIHGVCEVLERDIRSINRENPRSALVCKQTEPSKIASLRQQIENAGLELILRKTVNALRQPFYSAFILNEAKGTPISISDGYALHPCSTIAAVRAVTAAAKRHLSTIHNGQKDIFHRISVNRQTRSAWDEDLMLAIKKKIVSDKQQIPFSSPEESITDFTELNGLWEILVLRMAKAGLYHCFVFELNPETLPLSVVLPRAVHSLEEVRGMEEAGYN